MKNTSFHAGAFFEAIGEDFATLERADSIINADVLDAWFDPSPRVLQKLAEHLPFIVRTSPPNYSAGLIRTIAEVRGIPEANILPGGGSSDLIFLLLQAMVRHGDRAVLLDPMYGEYSHVLQTVIGATIIRHMLNKVTSFRLDVDAFLQDIVAADPSIVIIVNPNSPTGQYSPRAEIIRLLRSIDPEILVVIDETYIEYVGASESLEPLVAEFKNLIVVKSMSKVYALSGLRIGYLVASEPLIERLACFLPPWAVNLAGQIAAVEALGDKHYYAQQYELTHLYRCEMQEMCESIEGLRVYDSVSNFFLVELTRSRITASEIDERLRMDGIYVRNPDSMSTQFKDSFLRLAVKRPEHNQRIVSALAALLN
jgi:histidinol-phosphate aminotransferase